MRIALIGGGTIARLVLENVQRGKLPGLEVVALMGRAGGAPRLLIRFDDTARPSNRAEFATDGTRLFFTIGARQSDIWAMALRAR